MNETSVTPIGSIRTPQSGMSVKVIVPDPFESRSARERTMPGLNKAMKQTEAEKEAARHLSNISIQFNVDDETNRLIVVVTERESGRVIRTIPTSEFEKMHAGDLLKLTA